MCISLLSATTLYKALNTQNKKLSKLDIIRVDLFLNEPYAILFNGILTLCKLNFDGLGDADGDLVTGSGTRFISTVEIYGKDFSSYIGRAVSFMRDHWGTEDNPLEELRDDMIYGLTTLFVFLDYAGRVDGGTENGLNGKYQILRYFPEARITLYGIRPQNWGKVFLMISIVKYNVNFMIFL